MAMNKIERIDKEIAKTREKITEYQNRLRGLKRRKPKRKTCKSYSLCAPCAFPRMSFPLCFPAAVFRAWKPRRATPQNPQTTTPKKWRTPRMNKKILRTLTALCAALMLTGGFSVTAFAQTPEGQDATDDSGVFMRNPKRKNPLPRTGTRPL